MRVRLAIAALTLLASGVAVTAQRSGGPATSALPRSGMCKCEVFPWEPDPPCVNECSGLLIAEIPTNRLVMTLKLPEGFSKNLNTIKGGGVTKLELDKFLSSEEGNTFLRSRANASAADMRILGRDAESAYMKSKPQ